MRDKALLSPVLLASAIVFGMACGAQGATLDGLKLISVTAVDYYDRAELPPPATPPSLSRITGGQSSIHAVTSEKSHEPLLLAQYSGPTDVSRPSYASTMRVKSYLCSQPNARIFPGLPYVFMSGRDVRSGPGPNIPGARPPAGPFVYSIYFRVARQEGDTALPQGQAFDLREEPADICFAIAGGANRAQGYSSNVLRIPRETIATALRTAANAAPQ